MAKMIYNKKKSGRLMGGGGPRDKQEALRLRQQQELLRPSMTARVESMEDAKSVPKQSSSRQQTVDMSQFLPLDEVKKKIEEAVNYTRNAEQQKLNSGLNNINNQLKDMRKKAGKSEEELVNAKVEIRQLKQQVLDSPVVPVEFEKRLLEKDSEISTLNLKLETKGKLHEKSEKEIINLQNKIDSINKSDIRMTELQDKMDKLYDKIADGSIQDLVGSKMTRPMMEDKIFIDPLEKGKEPDLDAHIDITEEESVEEIGSDMITDLSKLKGLLNLD